MIRQKAMAGVGGEEEDRDDDDDDDDATRIPPPPPSGCLRWLPVMARRIGRKKAKLEKMAMHKTNLTAHRLQRRMARQWRPPFIILEH
jgi:hypothetical protein